MDLGSMCLGYCLVAVTVTSWDVVRWKSIGGRPQVKKL